MKWGRALHFFIKSLTNTGRVILELLSGHQHHHFPGSKPLEHAAHRRCFRCHTKAGHGPSVYSHIAFIRIRVCLMCLTLRVSSIYSLIHKIRPHRVLDPLGHLGTTMQ